MRATTSRHWELERMLHKCCPSVDIVEYFPQFLCRKADFLTPKIKYLHVYVLLKYVYDSLANCLAK